MQDLGVTDPTLPVTSTLTKAQLPAIAMACIKTLQSTGCITHDLLWSLELFVSPTVVAPSTLSTPVDRLKILPCDKAPSSAPAQR